MTARYIADTDGLGLGRPDHEPRASETIAEIIALIERLVERGHAYEFGGDVYFHVRSYPEYGELSHRNIDDMDQGEGLEGAERKRDPLDFALWKAQKPGEDTAWDSPWGPGRPGWHIECSAMAEELLGVGFEIHGGGSDLVFPHHENEAAQTAAARGVPAGPAVGPQRHDPARPGQDVQVGGQHLRPLRRPWPPTGATPSIMYFCAGHYRQPVEFDDERLEQAAASVRRVREAARRLVPGRPRHGRPRCTRSSSTPWPTTSIPPGRWPPSLAGSGRPTALSRRWGTRMCAPCSTFSGLASLLEAGTGDAPEAVQALAVARERARSARDWARADSLREEIAAHGWQVRDSPSGPELVPAA